MRVFIILVGDQFHGCRSDELLNMPPFGFGILYSTYTGTSLWHRHNAAVTSFLEMKTKANAIAPDTAVAKLIVDLAVSIEKTKVIRTTAETRVVGNQPFPCR